MSALGQAGTIKNSRAFRWTIGVGVGAILALSLVLLFLLTQATGNRELYERNYARLLVLNIVVAALLFGVIGWIVLRLYLRLCSLVGWLRAIFRVALSRPPLPALILPYLLLVRVATRPHPLVPLVKPQLLLELPEQHHQLPR